MKNIFYKIKDWFHYMSYGRNLSMGNGGHKFKAKTFIIRVSSNYLPCNKTGDKILRVITRIFR